MPYIEYTEISCCSSTAHGGALGRAVVNEPHGLTTHVEVSLNKTPKPYRSTIIYGLAAVPQHPKGINKVCHYYHWSVTGSSFETTLSC